MMTHLLRRSQNRAPFGYFYVGNSPSFKMSPASSPVSGEFGPLVTTPFVDRQNGISQLQRFPVAFPPLNVSPGNPDNSVEWNTLLPIVSSPGIDIRNRLPIFRRL
jgi:hypothetical protein